MKHITRIVVGGILAICLIAGCAAWFFYKTFLADNVKNQNVTIVVPPNATFDQVMDSLRKYDVLESERTFLRTVKILKYEKIKLGKYDLAYCHSNLELVRMLRAGQHYPVSFTFNNVRTADQFVEKVGHQFFF